MGARDLLTDLAGAGLRVTAEGDRLVIRPASKLTDCMRAALRVAKPELLALLRGEPDRTHARRRDRLIRWGWSEADAEALSERLERRDADDDRRTCVECSHYRPGRCGNHRCADLHTADVGRDLATMPQRCPGFGKVLCGPSPHAAYSEHTPAVGSAVNGRLTQLLRGEP